MSKVSPHIIVKTKKMLSARKTKKKKTEDEEMIEKEPKGSFAWKLFLPSQIRTLASSESIEDLEEKMALTLTFDNYEVDLKEAIQLDLFVIAFNWAKEKGFDDRQLGGFMSLLSNLLDNIRESKMTKEQNIKSLKECFVGVGLDNPEQIPISLYFYTLEQAQDITQYLLSTFFQHYVIYTYLFTQEQDELIIGTDITTEVSPENEGPFPPPLEEAMSVETHEKFAVKISESEPADTEPGEESLSDELTDAVLKVVESSDDPAVREVSADDLRRIIDKISKEMIIPMKQGLQQKIKEKELAYLARIGKIQPK